MGKKWKRLLIERRKQAGIAKATAEAATTTKQADPAGEVAADKRTVSEAPVEAPVADTKSQEKPKSKKVTPLKKVTKKTTNTKK